MKTALLLIASAAGLHAAATLTYTKSFPGSIPEYVYVAIDHSGALEYTESLKDDRPLKVQVPDDDTAELFSLAEKLGYFESPLESGLKVANTGKKTFRYQGDDGVAHEASFNYSTNAAAQQLLARFEQITASERAYLELDRTVRYDKLGVNDALAAIESLWLKKQLTAPRQFTPLLTRIATHDSFMHLVRERAARLKDQFEAGSAQAAAPQK